MKARIVKADFAQLNDFVKGLNTDEIVKVGIFSKKAVRVNEKKEKTPSGIGNPDLGAIHEFGSFTRNIPARSFLRMPLMQYGEEIVEHAGAGAEYHLAKGNVRQLLNNLGIACVRIVHRAFATSGFGSWARNAPSTIRRKGSDKPLWDTGQLNRSINFEVGKAS